MSLRAEPSWLLIGIALVPVLIELAAPRTTAAPPHLPIAGAGFSSKPLPLTPSEQALLARVPASKRAYRIDGRELFLVSLDATADRHAIHDASYCLQGKGWQILRDQIRELSDGDVRFLEARRNDGAVRHSVTFFESDGQRFTSTWRYLAEYVRARLRPGTRAVRYTVALTTDPAADCAWIASTALPRILAAR